MAKKSDEIQVIVFKENGYERYVLYPEDQEDRDRIFKSVFEEREDQGYYEPEEMNQRMLSLYEKSLKGDSEAISAFMSLRSGKAYEYETFMIHTLEQL